MVLPRTSVARATRTLNADLRGLTIDGDSTTTPATGNGSAGSSRPRGAEEQPDVGTPPSARAPRLEELLSRAAGGDQEAFAELYDETAPRVFGLALRVLGEPAPAEAVTVETYLHIWRECARFDVDRHTAIAWILAVAHANATARARALPAPRRGIRRLSHSSGRATARARSTGAGEPAREAGRVHRALGRLTPVQRESLEMAYFGGHTRSEVAGLTRTSEDAAASAIRDGLAQLIRLVDGPR